MTPSQEARDRWFQQWLIDNKMAYRDDHGFWLMPSMDWGSLFHGFNAGREYSGRTNHNADDYPEMPPGDAWPLGPAVPFFGPEKMRSYVDADRKARQQDALPNVHLLWKAACDEWGANTGGPDEYELFANKLWAAFSASQRIESWPTLVNYSRAIRALRAIAADPYGCPFCDSGKLRGAKPHDEECGFEQARQVLSTIEEGERHE